MDSEDEGTWNDCYGSVSLSLSRGYEVACGVAELLDCVGSMAIGLGVTPEEWEELKGNVDDSFWVMRVIGSLISPPLVFCD